MSGRKSLCDKSKKEESSSDLKRVFVLGRKKAEHGRTDHSRELSYINSSLVSVVVQKCLGIQSRSSGAIVCEYVLAAVRSTFLL